MLVSSISTITKVRRFFRMAKFIFVFLFFEGEGCQFGDWHP